MMFQLHVLHTKNIFVQILQTLKVMFSTLHRTNVFKLINVKFTYLHVYSQNGHIL